MGYSHVLITRPEPEAGQLAASFEGTPLTPVVNPAYAFEPLCPRLALDGAWPDSGRRLAVFTSTRAVEFGLRQLPAHFFDGVEIAAIGPATASALERAGLQVSLVPQGKFDSESFLGHPALAREPGRALIFAAPGGRELLQQGLGEQGWQVSVIHVYRRKDLEPASAALAGLVAATGVISVWTSENAMRLLAGALPEAAWQKICKGTGVVTSGRLGQALKELGVGRVIVAGGPGNEPIRASVMELI